MPDDPELVPRLRHPAQRQHPRLPGADRTRGWPVAPRSTSRRCATRAARAARGVLRGVDDRSILDHLGERGVGDDPRQRSPLWSRAAYDRYLEWAMESGYDRRTASSARS